MRKLFLLLIFLLVSPLWAANEIEYDDPSITGQTLYVVVKQGTNALTTGTTMAAYTTTRSDFDQAMTETGTTGLFTYSFPALPAGKYTWVIYQDANDDATPSHANDIGLALGAGDWDGTSFGTDLVAVDGNTTSPSNMNVVFSTDFADNYNTTNNQWEIDAAGGETLLASGTAQAQVDPPPNTIKLAADETDEADFFNETIITIVGGAGVGQARSVLDSDGDDAGQVLTVNRAWVVPVDETSEYEITKWGQVKPHDASIVGETFNIPPGAGSSINTIVHDEVENVVGANGTLLSDIPWNADWDAEVESESEDALNDFGYSAARAVKLDFLDVAVSEGAGNDLTLLEGSSDIEFSTTSVVYIAPPAPGIEDYPKSLVGAMVLITKTGEEPERSRVSAHTVGQNTLTVSPTFSWAPDDQTTVQILATPEQLNNLDVTVGSRLADANAVARVQTAVENNHLDHLLAVTYDPSAKPGVAGALLNKLVEGGGGGVATNPRWTEEALELTPLGEGGLTVDEIADAVWDEALPGAYDAGSAGKMVGDNLDAAISSRLATAGYTVPPSSTTIRDAILNQDLTAYVGATSAGLLLKKLNVTGTLANSDAADTYKANVSGLATQTSVDDIPTVSEFNARTLPSADYATDAASDAIGTIVADIYTAYELDGAGPNWQLKVSAVDQVWAVGTRALTDKVGFSLTQTFPANFEDLAIEDTTGKVTTNNTDFQLAPEDIDAIVDGVIAELGTGVLGPQVWDYLASSVVTSGSMGKLVKDMLNATVSSRAAPGAEMALMNDALTGAKIDPTAVTEIQAGLATGAAVTNVPAAVRTNLATELARIDIPISDATTDLQPVLDAIAAIDPTGVLGKFATMIVLDGADQEFKASALEEAPTADVNLTPEQLTTLGDNIVEAVGTSGGGTLTARVGQASLAPDKFLPIIQGEEKTITFIVEAVGRFNEAQAETITVKMRGPGANATTIQKDTDDDPAAFVRVTEELDVQVFRVTLDPTDTAALSAGLTRIEIDFDNQKAMLTHSVKIVESVED
jgi:hypothetical protein